MKLISGGVQVTGIHPQGVITFFVPCFSLDNLTPYGANFFFPIFIFRPHIL